MADSVQSLYRIGDYFLRVRPAVSRALSPISDRARAIPQSPCRALALDALSRKRFHCEGGAVLAGGAAPLTRIIALYQTLCDYLDTLTDRGPALGEHAIARLHLAAVDALSPRSPLHDHWNGHPLHDGGYLEWLTSECRRAVDGLPGFPEVQPRVAWLARRYGELQSLKHSRDGAQRGPRLARWHALRSAGRWDVEWWEFAAACGSTLGIFALLAEAAEGETDPHRVGRLFECYFPWIGGLHILLDYLIDRSEDVDGGDFNLVACYPDRAAALRGIAGFYRRSIEATSPLRDAARHRWIAQGLPAFYLADRKASLLPQEEVRHLIALGGTHTALASWFARIGRSP